MAIQRDFTIDLMKDLMDKSQRRAKVIIEACKSISELDIPEA